MTDVMLAQPPGGRGDVISAILNDYATPRDSYDEQELMGNDVPELPAKDENPPESLRLNKPLPPMGRRLREAQAGNARTGNAGTRDTAAAESATAAEEAESPKIQSRSIARTGKPTNLKLFASNGSTATPEAGAAAVDSRSFTSPTAGTTSSSSYHSSGPSSSLPPNSSKRTPPSLYTKDRPLPTVPDLPPPPPKTDMKKIMGSSQSRGLPSNPKDTTGRSPLDGFKAKFTGKRKPASNATPSTTSASDLPSPPAPNPPPTITATSPGSESNAKPLPPVRTPIRKPVPLAKHSVGSSTQNSFSPPSSNSHSRETSSATAITSASTNPSFSTRSGKRSDSPVNNEDKPKYSPIAEPVTIQSPSPILEETPSKYGLRKREGEDDNRTMIMPSPKTGLPPTPKAGLPPTPKLNSTPMPKTDPRPTPKIGLPSGPRAKMGPPSAPTPNKTSPGLDMSKDTQPSHSRQASANPKPLSPPDSAGSASEPSPQFSYNKFTHPSIQMAPATPRSSIDHPMIAPPPQRWTWIYLSNRPPNSTAQPLTQQHIDCFTHHARFRPSSNKKCPVACMLCFTDEGDRSMCSHCCLRVCMSCVRQIRDNRGKSISAIVDLDRARYVGKEG